MSEATVVPPAGFWPGLRFGRFMTAERAWLYGLAVIIAYVGVLAAVYVRRDWLIGPDGRPIAVDFVNFWSAGIVTATHHAGDLYDIAFFKTVQVQAIGHDFDGFFAWVYPPPVMLLAAPLHLLPYQLAWLIWIGGTAALFTAALRLFLPTRLAVPLALAGPPALWCTVVGQNGFLTAALTSAALALLARRPGMAGACIGLLTYKPQFGLLLPLFLICGRHGRAFATATITALLLGGVSMLVYGMEVWRIFAASLAGSSGTALLDGGEAWFRLQSFYAIFRGRLFRDIEPDLAWAMIAHIDLSALVLAVMLWFWTRPYPDALKAASLCAATFLVTPYAYVYDATLLMAALAFLVRDGLDRGFLPWDKALLCTAWAIPALFGLLGSTTVPLDCLLVLAMAVRRGCQGALQRA